MATLIHDFTRQIKAELQLLNSNEQINSFLIYIEQKIGLKQKQIIYCNVNLLYFL
jgi:hypothetical protein